MTSCKQTYTYSIEYSESPLGHKIVIRGTAMWFQPNNLGFLQSVIEGPKRFVIKEYSGNLFYEFQF